MAQTATAWASAPALNIHETTTAPLTVHSNDEFAAGLGNKTHSGNTTFYEGVYFRATSQLKYGDRVKISFTVSEAHRINFTLIKGLLEFHRAATTVFTYNRTEGTFEATIEWQRLQELHKFIAKISTWVDQELSFKRQLKQMRAFESEYRARLAKIYAGGEGFTLFQTV